MAEAQLLQHYVMLFPKSPLLLRVSCLSGWGIGQMLERAVSDIAFKLEAFALHSPPDCTRMSITSPVVSTQSLYSQRYKSSLLPKSYIPVWGAIHWFSKCCLTFTPSYHIVPLQIVFKVMIIRRLNHILLQYAIQWNLFKWTAGLIAENNLDGQ